MSMTDAASAAQAKASNTTTIMTMGVLEDVVAVEYCARASDIFVAGAAPHPALQLLTICVIVTKTGFTVVGKSAPVDPANFDPELGRRFAREDALRQLWPLEGYLMKQRLHDVPAQQSPDTSETPAI